MCIFLLLTVSAAACVAEGAGQRDAGAREGPDVSSYRCDEDTRMTVEQDGGLVHVNTPRGLRLDLPAAPPQQHSRYGETPYALVMNGGEALWMVAGKIPLNCLREGYRTRTASID